MLDLKQRERINQNSFMSEMRELDDLIVRVCKAVKSVKSSLARLRNFKKCVEKEKNREQVFTTSRC